MDRSAPPNVPRPRGRTSAAAMAVTAIDACAVPLQPPSRLSAEEAVVWKETIACVKPGWFRGSEVVLELFCRAVVVERRLGLLLRELDPADERFADLAKMHRAEAMLVGNLAGKLRWQRGTAKRRNWVRRRFRIMTLWICGKGTLMRRIDREALRRALRIVAAKDGRRPPPESEWEAWLDAATGAAYHCQMRALHLPPWCDPPCFADEDRPRDDFPSGGKVAAWELRRRLMMAGLSAFEPDPVAALDEAARQRVALVE